MDELVKNNNDTIYNLNLSCGESAFFSTVRLSITPSFNELFIFKDEPEQRGIFEKIKEILVKRERFYKRFVNPNIGLILSFVGLAVLGIRLYFHLPQSFFSALIFWSSQILAFFIIYSNIFQKGNSKIILKNRSNQETFWKRNKEQVFLLLIGAAIGVITTVIGSIVLNYINK